jgi:hypothetical protein
MAPEFVPPARLEEIGLLQRRMQEACQSLGLEGLLAEAVLAAGVAAWSALLLSGAGSLSLDLERQPHGLCLRLGFDPAGNETPPGLVSALFCPPARGAGLRWQGRRRLFEVQWDV